MRPNVYWAVLLLLASFVCIGARWIWLYRRGQPLDIDEAGYLGITLIDYGAWLHGGFQEWLSAIEAPSIQGPLTTAAASLVMLLTGPHIVAAFAVPLMATAVCIWVTFELGRSIGGRRVGLEAALLVASCPAFINYSRSFQFSMTAALVTTLALLAMVRSQRFSAAAWVTTFGVCLGFMPLARTMTIAFLPGMVVAAVVYTFGSRHQLLRRLTALAGSLCLAILVSETWLYLNGKYVFDYLFSFGYGGRAVEFGPPQSKFGLDAWISTVQNFVRGELFLPHFMIIVLAAIVLVFIVVSRAARDGASHVLRACLSSPMLPICVVIVEAIVALTSSRNKGTAFFAPIIPAILVVACWSLHNFLPARMYKRVLLAIIFVVSVLITGPTLDLRSSFVGPRTTDVPVLGMVTVVDGRGLIQKYEAEGGLGNVLLNQPISLADGQDWIDLSRSTAKAIDDISELPTVVLFGFRHRLYNVNTVNLLSILTVHKSLALKQVEPTVTGDTRQGYVEWLRTSGRDGCILLTSDDARGDFLPVVVRSFMNEAAVQSGFIPRRHLTKPDGGSVTLWVRKASTSTCPIRLANG